MSEHRLQGASRPGKGDGKYYLWSSKAQKDPNVNGQALERGSREDKFVSLLKKGFIVLAAEPTETNPVVDIDDSDVLSKWLSILNNVMEPGFKFSVKFNKDKKIESFHFAFSNPWVLPLASTADGLKFSFGDEAKQIPPPGISEDGKTLFCGLDSSQIKSLDPTVHTVISYSGLASLLEHLPKEICAMKVHLDKTIAEHNRTALWFSAAPFYKTTFRAQFKLGTLQALQKELRVIRNLTIDNASIVCKRVVGAIESKQGMIPVNKGQIIFFATCLIGYEKFEMSTAIAWLETYIIITLRPKNSGALEAFGVILKWIADSTEAKLDVKELLDQSKAFDVNGVKLRSVSITLDLGERRRPITTVSDVDVSIEVPAKFGQSQQTEQTVVFLVSYSWSEDAGGLGTVQGRLWNDFNTGETAIDPEYEEWSEMKPLTQNAADHIELAELVPGDEKIENAPNYLPTNLTQALIFISDKSIGISAAVESNKNAEPGNVPQPYLGQLGLSFTYSWRPRVFKLQFGVMAGLLPSTTSKNQDPAMLQGLLDFDSGTKSWEVKASLHGLYASTLAEFFDKPSAAHVMPLIDSIALEELSLDYKYTKLPGNETKSVGSSFNITGNLLIAGLKLKLEFNYTNTWTFTAALQASEPDATVGEVIKGILGDSQISLPPFLADMPFNDKDAIHIDVTKEKGSAFQFTANIRVAAIDVIFVQYHGGEWDEAKPSKRLLKVAVNPVSDFSIPIDPIGKIEQPLDEVSFMWVQDDTGIDKETPGFLRKEINSLSESVQSHLVLNDKFKDQKDTDTLLSAGSHFFILAHKPGGQKDCILDYCFNKTSRKTVKATEDGGDDGNDDNSNDETDGGGAQAPLKKKTGPLTIKNVGLKWSGKLIVSFDATLELGPLKFSLLGFSLGIEIKNLTESTITPGIEGLAVSYDKKPLEIAGIIRHGTSEGLDYWAGGLIIGFVPWEFTAAGFYGDATGPKGTNFKSVFVFAKLNGPLLTLEFGEISGVTGGFGYQSDITLPSVDKVVTFPFVDSRNVPGESALKALETLVKPGGWFKPLENTYWAAAGLKVTAFEMIALDAVAVVQFGPSIRLNIVAVATGDIPALKSSAKFAHIELGILVMVDFDAGLFKAEAQLSPNSYILHPDCHLTGGFGLYYWFDAPHSEESKAGDFVFTLGGYHQAFVVPTGYPNPPRLGISWSLGSNLSISGQSYFAITPKVCMGGGRLHASFFAGPIEAWFDAFADFLINYKPFHFIANAGISVGVRMNIDILFIHTSDSAEIAADLTLWGPPVAGKVHVNFWVTSFDINFGDSAENVKPLSLLEFYELCLQASSPKSSQVASTAVAMDPIKSRMNEGHVFVAQSGLLNNSEKPEKEQSEKWTVRAGTFSFVVSCKVAIKTATLTGKAGKTLTSVYDVYGKPTKLTQPLTSKLTVTIDQGPSALEAEEEQGWRMKLQKKNVPSGLWQQYSSATDPAGGNNHIKDLLNADSGGIPQIMDVVFTAPPPIMAPDKFPVFDILDAQVVDLNADKPFPDSQKSHPDWQPAKPKDGKAQWKEVHDRWKSPALGETAQQSFVSMFEKAFNWGETKLNYKIPHRLEKRFNDLYIAAPLLTV